MIFFVLLLSILALLEMKKQAVVTQTKNRKKGCAKTGASSSQTFFSRTPSSAGSRGIVRFRSLMRFVANFRAYDTYKTA